MPSVVASNRGRTIVARLDARMIALQDVSKFYRIEGYRKVVLNHVSYNFEAGHSYGILGVNGAGKSTLIRILAGTELPNAGRVRRSVRVSWPLGFAGMHPGMTGRENVRFIARAYGEDIKRTVDFVEDFAEIGHYLDEPVKFYSSGMYLRLAFSVSAHLDADILLIDEALAVGDMAFEEKCRKRIRSMVDNGRTVVLVSHQLDSIRTLCDEAMVLDSGRLAFTGSPGDAVRYYEREFIQPSAAHAQTAPA